jgi:hypothetical protein
MKTKARIEKTISWNDKEIEIISQLNRFFEREGYNIWELGHDEKKNECFYLNINNEYSKIYKTNENEYTIIDTEDKYSNISICNLKELITTRLHLYISFGYGSHDSEYKDNIVCEDISWEQYAEKLIETI